MSALCRKTQLCESSPTLVRRPLTFADTTVSCGAWAWLERVCRGGLTLGMVLVRARGRGPFAWRESSLFLPFFSVPSWSPERALGAGGMWGWAACLCFPLPGLSSGWLPAWRRLIENSTVLLCGRDVGSTGRCHVRVASLSLSLSLSLSVKLLYCAHIYSPHLHYCSPPLPGQLYLPNTP